MSAGALPHSRTERTIAAARVLLAASSLLAVWLDPAEPARNITLTYALHSAYTGYSILLTFIIWNRSSSGRLPLVTHVADIAAFSVFQYLTLGPSSPFFVYFVFSLFCGALRWGWRGTLGTAVVVTVAFLMMGVSMSRTLGPTEFELNRFIIRTVYLLVVAGLLVYLGQHEVRLRAQIERLARWPAAVGLDIHATVQRVLEHAAHTVRAGRVLVAWDASDEPWLHLARWSPSVLTITKHPPTELDPLVPLELSHAAIVCTSTVGDEVVALVRRDGVVSEWRGRPMHAALLAHVAGSGFASAPFRTERIAGRAFFTDLDAASTELMTLTALVAREIGASLDQLHTTEQLAEIAASEQRIRVARDLHDGVLQSLTGVRFELQTVATDLQAGPASVRERLLAIEHALALEQRELRLFIEGLKPAPGAMLGDSPLAVRLQDVQQRIALAWKAPVSIRVSPRTIALPGDLEQAVTFMVHEAAVNALKHADPSRVAVEVTLDERTLRIAVVDDGAGFPFRGRYGHADLARMNLGPESLRQRAGALGGEMTIESSGAGSRVEIAVPVARGRV